MAENIVYNQRITVDIAEVADTVPLTTAVHDMKGYEGIAFVIGVAEGAIVNGYHIKAQQDTTSGFTGAADLEGSDVSFASAAGIVTRVLDIKTPSERYVRGLITVPNGSATAITTVTAIQYGGRTLPETNTGGEFHIASEGTA